MQLKDYSNQKTVYEMKDIIKRCFDECEKAGHIGDVVGKKMIRNPDEVASHISKTLMGELMEFEVLRRLGPALRSMKNVENDLEFLYRKQLQEASLGNLRIGEK